MPNRRSLARAPGAEVSVPSRGREQLKLDSGGSRCGSGLDVPEIGGDVVVDEAADREERDDRELDQAGIAAMTIRVDFGDVQPAASSGSARGFGWTDRRLVEELSTPRSRPRSQRVEDVAGGGAPDQPSEDENPRPELGGGRSGSREPGRARFGGEALLDEGVPEHARRRR